MADAIKNALAALVRLHDGPRDEQYEWEKPHAWRTAREVLDLQDPVADAVAAAAERGRQQVIAQVLALHSPAEGWEREWKDPALALANGWPMCAGCAMPGIGQRDLAHCPTRALLIVSPERPYDHDEVGE